MPIESTQKRAIMFADIVGSSKLYVEKGNRKAQTFIADALKIMSHLVYQHTGIVVKTIGDEIMAAFDSPTHACRAGIAINNALNEYNISMRIGISFGNVIVKNDDKGNLDVFGDTVNNAAFLARLAQAKQIIITQDTHDACEKTLASKCEPFDNVPLKGKSQSEYVHRISWENNNEQTQVATAMIASPTLSQTNTSSRLYLCTPEKTYIVEKNTDRFVCGRDPQSNNIFIVGDKISRKHCSFYFVRGKFVIEDHSTNGTYMQPSDSQEPPVYIRRETMPLALAGTINLGQAKGTFGPQIRFEIHFNALD